MASAINRHLPVSSVTCFTAIIVVSMITSSACEDFCRTPRPPNCSCTITKDIHILHLLCPTLAVQVDFQKETMNIRCSNNTSDISVLSDMHIGRIDKLTVQQCPLFPVQDIGVYGTSRLTIIDPEVRGSVSPQMLFRGLIDVTHLTLHTTDVTIFSDAFIEMPNLYNLILVFNNTDLTKSTFCSAPNVFHLELTNNNLAYLQPDIFHCLSLSFLKLNGKIHNISRVVFTLTNNLLFLVIKSNKLSILPADAFMDLPLLFHVALKSNEFSSLPQNLFTDKAFLKDVEIQDNVITLKTLPSGFLANLSSLSSVTITNNSLNSLPEDLFWGSNFIFILSLSRNNITSLPPLLFRDCNQLFSLDIDFNQITDLPSQLFSDTQRLNWLSLNNNRLTHINHDTFRELRVLEYLDLSNNRIKHVGENAFPALLMIINMTNNVLTRLPSSMPRTLEHIDIANNSLTSINASWINMAFLNHLNLSHNKILRIQTADLNFGSNESISVDLSYNIIYKIDFSNADTVYRLPLETEKQYLTFLKRRYIYIAGNPFYDNCEVYNLVELKSKNYNSVVFFINDNLQYVQPIPQVSFVEYIPLKKLTCLLTEVDNPTCPEQCSCLYRFSGNTLLVNCDERNYSSMPKAVPDVKFSGHTLLNLSTNNIKAVKPPLGLGYHKVTKYILSDNEINEIDLTAFSPTLQVLELNGNLITQFNKSSIEFLKNATNLIELTLHQNPWKCDCTTEDTVELIEFFYNVKKIKQLENTTCENGKYVWNISNVELCPVDSEMFLIVTVLAFGLMIGIINLYYRFQTEIKIWLYSHRFCLWFISEEELDRDKVYDAFVSYAHSDEDFVVDHLIPGLENGSIRYRLCLHQRDWIPGDMIPTQITRSIEESRRTIIVLSEHFLNSTWGRMEFCVAHTQALNERRIRLIVIMYGDIGQTNKLDAELRAYLTMNTYVKWGDPFFWEKLRYALPHRL